jgi:hypothetical protein
MEFIISGLVREKESKQPAGGLLVRAFDRDLFYTDLLGNAVTAANGTFVIAYRGKDFQELFEKKPDIYLEIYGSAAVQPSPATAMMPIFTTRRHVRFNAGKREFFLIEIPRAKLGEDAPGQDIISPPQAGKWKDRIDDFFKNHPPDFHHDPDKGFMKPLLTCTSNFGPEIIHLNTGDTATVTVTVTNEGNGPSFFTYVEIYEGPSGYTHPLQDYRLCDYRVLTLYPGQTADVKLRWNRLLAKGRIVGVCFDPLMDPRGFHVVEQYNPHITSMHY